MALSFNVDPGYTFSDGEKVDYPKLNLLGSPAITLNGSADTSEITNGAITTEKLASGIDINSKISDHNIALAKLASGTHGQVLYYDGSSDLVTLAPGSAGQFLKTNGAGADPEWANQAGLTTVPISMIVTDGADKFLSTDGSGNIQWETKKDQIQTAVIWHQEVTNADAEASTTSASARKLTNKTDPDGLVTLGSTDFTLAAGTYLFDGQVSVHSFSDSSVAWLYDTTGTATLINGGSCLMQNSNNENNWIPVKGRFTLGATSTLEIRQIATAAVSGGYGKAVNLGSQPEVYTQAIIQKIA